jgi:glucokinase
MSAALNQADKFVGIEISNSSINGVCVDKNGELAVVHNVLLNKESDPFSNLVNFINEIRDSFGSFDKIGIAVPGLINRETRRVAFSTFIPEHEKTDFFREIETETGVRILIENDANAAAYGEFLIGAGRGSRNMFYATLGTGVGGAIIFDGKIWHGASGFAGEFGHIAINSEGLKLEGVASSANIVERTRSRYHQDHTSSLSKIGEYEITLNDIINAAKNEDDFAQMMLERTGNYVGTAIAGVINLLNIEKIVIGGDIMQAEHFVLEAIILRAKKLSFAPSFETTEILVGKLGENAAAIGAGLLSAEY